MPRQFSKLMHNVILDSPIPPKLLAKQIDKPYSTLLREVNPYDRGAKLGVETFIDILKATGNTAPIEFIANELGLEVVPKNA